jgi:hypothetical protein
LYWDQSVSLGTVAADFGPFTFTAATSDPTAALRFFVGKSTTDVLLDAVVVTEAAPAAREGAGWAGTDGALRLYPNPAHGELNVAYHSEADQEVRTSLIHLATGTVVQRNSFRVMRGSNTLRVGVANVREGAYLLRAEPSRQGAAAGHKVLITR